MNTTQKMIAAVAIVAVLAVAAVGAGFAYTAQTSNDDNTATTAYLTVTPGTGLESDFKENFMQDVLLDTVTSWDPAANDNAGGMVTSYAIAQANKIAGAKYAGADIDAADVGNIVLNVAQVNIVETGLPNFDLKVSFPKAKAIAGVTYYAFVDGSPGAMSKFVEVGDNMVALAVNNTTGDTHNIHVAVAFAEATQPIAKVFDDATLTFTADSEAYTYEVADAQSLVITGAETAISYKTGETISDYAAAKAAIIADATNYVVNAVLANGMTKVIESTGYTLAPSTADGITASEPEASQSVEITVTATMSTGETSSVSGTVVYTVTNANSE